MTKLARYPVWLCPKCVTEMRDGTIAVYKQTFCPKCGEPLSTYCELTNVYYLRDDITFRIKEGEK